MPAEYKGKYSMDDPRRYSDPAYTQYLMERAKEVGEENRAREEAEQRRFEKDAQKASFAQLGGQLGGMAVGAYGANAIRNLFTGGAAGASGGAATGAATASGVATPTVLSGAPVTTSGGTFSSLMPSVPSMASVAPIAGVLGGVALGAKGVKDLFDGDSGLNSAEGIGGRATLGIATGGISELARALGVFDHKSTRDYARERTDELSGMSDAEPWQNYVTGMREQYNEAPPDPSKPFAGGKYGSWEEYEKAGLEADDLTGVYGNMKTYGPQYADLTFDQQKALTQKNIDAGNYYSSKGDVLMRDEELGRKFLDDILSGQGSPVMKPAGLENITDPAAASSLAGLLAGGQGAAPTPDMYQPTSPSIDPGIAAGGDIAAAQSALAQALAGGMPHKELLTGGGIYK